MTTAAPSAALAAIQPAFTDAERVALAGFLAGYHGLTREAYALDLRQFASWHLQGEGNRASARRIRTDSQSFPPGGNRAAGSWRICLFPPC